MFKLIKNSIARLKNSNKEIFHLAGFGLVYLVWNYNTFFVREQFLATNPSSMLDASWVVGLNWASFLHLRWLEDSLVFTYGPLYYLSGKLMPEFHSHRMTMLTNIGLNLFYTACFTYIYSLFADLHFKSKSRWIAIIVILMLFFQKPDISLVPLCAAFIFLPVIFSEDDDKTKTNFKRYVRYGIITLLLSVTPFVKFSHLYESFMFIIVMTGFSVYRRRYLDAALIGILFVAFTLLTWVLTTGENVLSFFPYLASRLGMASGYTEAMMTNFDGASTAQIFISALLFLTALTIVLIYLLFTKRWRWATAWLLPMITLFLGFKALIRADTGHTIIFLGYVFLAALYYYYLLELINVGESGEEPSTLWRQSAARSLTPLLILMVISTFYFSGGMLVIDNQFLAVTRLSEKNVYSQTKDQGILKEFYNLDPEFVSRVDKKETIDIIPWDIALLYGYDLHWKPRPVIQSYASYTSSLDHLDASFFQRPDAPGQLIYSLFSIDQRYSLFDTPHTFRALLDTYQFATHTENKTYALLTKRQEPLSRDLVLIDQKEYGFNEDISIPRLTDGHVFMTVEIEPTLMGRFLNIAYKPTILFIEIKLDTGKNVKHRLIRDTAKNGLFISNYVRNLDDLRSIFNETYKQNITSVRFTGDTGLYNNLISIHFYKIAFNH